MAKFIEVNNRHKKYLLNISNITSIHSIDRDGYKTKINFKDPVIVFSSKDIAGYQRDILITESYDDIKELIS